MIIQVTPVAVVLGFWASLYLLDVYLKQHERLSTTYTRLLGKMGITVSMMRLRFYTTFFNRIFIKMGSVCVRFWIIWFNFGVAVSLVLMICSSALLFLLVYNTLTHTHIEQQILTPVMPGVNLPNNQLVYYLLTLLCCTVLHELGHAVAAAREKVRINGSGLMAMIVFPGAFVDLHRDHLMFISPLRQLRIYCAGVWHNVLLTAAAALVMYLLPCLLLPAFSLGKGVVVTQVAPQSAVSGARGLVPGQVLRAIDMCPIYTVNDWRHCLMTAEREAPRGYCVPTDHLPNKSGATEMDCCSAPSETHLCFNYNMRGSKLVHETCLVARSTLDHRSCHLLSDCPSSSVCVTPVLDTNTSRLLKVHRSYKSPLIFLGPPSDLLYSVALSNYTPRSSLFSYNLPYVIETFSKYILSLSGALALLNVVPCYALDGQFILHAAMELPLFRSYLSPAVRNAWYSALLFAGTLLLLANVVLGLRSLLYS